VLTIIGLNNKLSLHYLQLEKLVIIEAILSYLVNGVFPDDIGELATIRDAKERWMVMIGQ
jgi:hypothetical protein